MELGWAYPRRRELIDRLLRNVTVDQHKHPIHFQDERKFFPIHKVEIGMPKYRLQNGRTTDAQEEIIAEEGLPEDFFERDIELEEAHKKQHIILKKQLKIGGIDLLSYFKDRDQEEPLILDNNGFVVNGNRRLCTMRELNQEDINAGKHNRRFSHIEVIILPPCSEDDILTLEGKLQIVEDIKADYVWTAEGCMYRSLRDKKHYTTERIAGIYDKKKEYIEELILLLSYVDQYLASRNIPKKYQEIINEKFAFEAIVKGRKKLGDNVDKKELFQTIAFSVIENPLSGMGRLHSFIPKIVDNLDAIIERAKQVFPLEGDESTEVEDFAEGLLGGVEVQTDLSNLVQTLDKEENRENVVHVAKDVIDAEEDRQQRYTVIQKIQRANSLLQDAVNIFDEDTEQEGIEAQLDSIEAHIAELKGKLLNVTH
ncbi:hypothetical protein ACPZJV_04860 [Bacillus velezensis]|uniref:hypothetical protein n=1 Tax=Bacillus TaxID=1386 RepID=UPI000446CB88|nr:MULTISPECIES: hypothetical protein [Bacillus amyloliquefaciens group]AXY36812.1 hypothetical protein D3C60_03190 [Bacillus velezensis]EYB35636.1 hypothetical protein AW26_0114615 [Bacillus amyloliquefaciens EBL11]MCQ9152216.1 hypothetical protein [Bacillus amyloliquefaciens]MEC0928173.1 hypothetical protein [Bacillus velezensis]MEC0971498.1 hypothetical protein [Bacillus velezensis]